MRAGRQQCRAADLTLCVVVIEPIFTRFEAGYYGMAGGVSVFRGVLAGRTVTATDVSTFGTPPEVEPPTTRRQTLYTSLAAWL